MTEPDIAEFLRQWKLGKDTAHSLKCALTTLAYQLTPGWTAEECREHILYLADELGALEQLND